MMNGGYLEILNVGVLNIPSLGQKSYQEFQHSEFHKFFIGGKISYFSCTSVAI